MGIVHDYSTLDLALMVPYAKTFPIMSSHQFSRFLHMTHTAALRIQGYNALVLDAYI